VRVQQLFDLSGKIAVVTGGGSGLGRQMAEGLAECGANVVLCARTVERCEQVAEDLRALGIQALALACDVRDPPQIQAVIDAAVAEFGTVDILVNNAGTSWGASPEEMPLAAWQKVIDVNLTGPFLFSQAAGNVMIREGGGKVINIASVAAFKGAPAEALNAIGYNASKGGLVSFTRDLAVKWAKYGINVNAIAPGWFPSEMSQVVLERSGGRLVEHIPLGRYGGDHDLKGAVAFLASAASDFVTGITLPVDGGELAR
jgi:gluconate 5-dehydrogenase